MDYIQNRELKIRLLRSTHLYVQLFGTRICTALKLAEESTPIRQSYLAADSEKALHAIHRYVMKAIEPYLYYHEWVCGNYADAMNNPTLLKATEGRLAWIDWMIACYEEDIANYKEQK